MRHQLFLGALGRNFRPCIESGSLSQLPWIEALVPHSQHYYFSTQLLVCIILSPLHSPFLGCAYQTYFVTCNHTSHEVRLVPTF